jgi:hypothetical protein
VVGTVFVEEQEERNTKLRNTTRYAVFLNFIDMVLIKNVVFNSQLVQKNPRNNIIWCIL